VSPDVSIVIPTRNRPVLTAEAVSSALDQEGVIVEVLVVDDGSTDRTAQLLESRYDNKIDVIRQDHQGACVARNRGLEEAKGRYVKFLDSDDLLEPDSLKAQVDLLEKSGAAVCYGDWQFMGDLNDPRVGKRPLRIMGDTHDPITSLLSDQWWVAPFGYLLRREAISGIFWNSDLQCLQDFDFILKIALSGAMFVYCPILVGKYRIHAAAQITESSHLKYAYNRCSILDQLAQELDKRKNLTDIRKQLISEQYWSAARAFYRVDSQLFADTVCKIHRLRPNFWPGSKLYPVILRFITGLLGIKITENIVSLGKRIVQGLRG